MAEELGQTAAAAAWLLERLVIGEWVSSSDLKAEAISLGFSVSAYYAGRSRVGVESRWDADAGCWMSQLPSVEERERERERKRAEAQLMKKHRKAAARQRGYDDGCEFYEYMAEDGRLTPQGRPYAAYLVTLTFHGSVLHVRSRSRPEVYRDQNGVLVASMDLIPGEDETEVGFIDWPHVVAVSWRPATPIAGQGDSRGGRARG